MITTGTKFFFGLAAAALVGAIFFGLATSGHEIGMDTLLGVITFGYKGAVGDQVGYSIFMALFGSALFLGVVASAFRDADPEAEAQVVGLETVPAAPAPQGTSYWPIIAAFGAGSVAVGVVVGSPMVFLGVGILVAAGFEWAMKAWSERATGDPEVNRAIRNRIMYPVEIPVLAVVGIAVFVLSISRVLIALPEGGGYAVFGGVPVLILLGGWLVTARPNLNRNLISAVLLVGGIAVLAAGVISASVGPREIEKHHAEGGEEGSVGVVQPGAPVVVGKHG